MSSFCWSCLSRLRPTPRAATLLPPTASRTLPAPAPATATTASFHTTPPRNANPPKKSSSQPGAPKHRQATTFRMQKKKPVERNTKPPASGERKAIRKRIILSNPNALEVEGMQDLSPATMVDSRLRGSVVGLPMNMLEQLRAVQAFQPSQGWSIFRRPGTVMRRETLEMGRLIERISEQGKGEVVKRIVTGVRGCGKSVHLLQGMAMAFLKGWVVFTVPDTQELVNAHTGYAPLGESKPTVYVQNEATAALLSRTLTANKQVLSGLKVSRQHSGLPAIKPGQTSLEDLARLGIQDPATSWTVFQALWAELTASGPASGNSSPFQPRPPILVTVDNISHWMKPSEYRNPAYEPIHAHDLVFVKHFLSLLQPSPAGQQPALPNGGLLLYATSTSNSKTIYSFETAIKQLSARTRNIHPGHKSFPIADLYLRPDPRVLETFAAPQPSSPQEGKLELQTLSGLTRDETRGFLEYFAMSGILREKLDDEAVGEKWSLASGGVVGELEKLGKRLRTIA